MGVKVDFSEIYALNERLQKEVNQEAVDGMIEKIVNEANNRHLARTVAKTPVVTGDLRAKWAHGIQPARFEGRTCIARLTNPLEYASYVEYGHRTKNNKGWVEGQFFMSKSLGKVKGDLKKISEREIKRLLGGVFDGK